MAEKDEFARMLGYIHSHEYDHCLLLGAGQSGDGAAH